MGERALILCLIILSLNFLSFGFSADPDPAVYLNADPSSGSHCQTNANLCGSDKKLNFDLKIYLNLKVRTYPVGNRSKSLPTKVQRSFKGRKLGLFVKFVQFPCSWIQIRICISNTEIMIKGFPLLLKPCSLTLNTPPPSTPSPSLPSFVLPLYYY
jgi:hypothetical protein